MTLSLETLRGYHLYNGQDTFGRVRDILIEEGAWTGRWLVVDTGDWLLGKKVLLSPVCLGQPDETKQTLEVKLTKQEIENAPPLDEHAPVSRKYEKTYFDQFEWPYYWNGGGLWGNPSNPYSLNPGLHSQPQDLPENPENHEPVLRSGHELRKYRLFSGDDSLGYMEDLSINKNNWSVETFKFDTRKWLHGKSISIKPENILRANWKEHRLFTDLKKDEIQGKIVG